METFKECTKCAKSKLLTDFPRHRGSKDGRAWACKICQAAQTTQWRKDNPVKAKEAQDSYRSRKPLNQYQSHIRRQYGIDTADYNRLLAAQNYGCAICGTKDAGRPKKSLCVDHVSGTLDIRGILCSACNAAIGLLKHDPQLLDAAKIYLSKGVCMTGKKMPRGVHWGDTSMTAEEE